MIVHPFTPFLCILVGFALGQASSWAVTKTYAGYYRLLAKALRHDIKKCEAKLASAEDERDQIIAAFEKSLEEIEEDLDQGLDDYVIERLGTGHRSPAARPLPAMEYLQ